ncbi:hypothetical protein F4781DRAFT_416159 [Annulohypoxylon bovei var. microspora]|nr:hypothetical protein F4781DRAFT_416159 [Annulohypoxylon bovei var. microspora]
MAELLRASRPWLLSSLKSRAPSPVLSSLCRSITTTSPLRKKSTRRESSGRRAAQFQSNFGPTITVLIPKSLIVPPLSRFPREPSKFFHMIWLILKTRWEDLRTFLSAKVVSMSLDKGKFRWPRFKYQKSAVVPAAKALHVQMSSALAAGDKETLRYICTGELYQTLAGAIDSRPKGVRSEWQLLRYNRLFRYPRLADWKVGYRPNGSGLTKQAIVSIASAQHIARYDELKGGVMIEGSERVRHVVEHIVMQSNVSDATYEATPWKIWGTLPESTYESILQGIEDYQYMVEDLGEK